MSPPAATATTPPPPAPTPGAPGQGLPAALLREGGGGHPPPPATGAGASPPRRSPTTQRPPSQGLAERHRDSALLQRPAPRNGTPIRRLPPARGSTRIGRGGATSTPSPGGVSPGDGPPLVPSLPDRPEGEDGLARLLRNPPTTSSVSWDPRRLPPPRARPPHRGSRGGLPSTPLPAPPPWPQRGGSSREGGEGRRGGRSPAGPPERRALRRSNSPGSGGVVDVRRTTEGGRVHDQQSTRRLRIHTVQGDPEPSPSPSLPGALEDQGGGPARQRSRRRSARGTRSGGGTALAGQGVDEECSRRSGCCPLPGSALFTAW